MERDFSTTNLGNHNQTLNGSTGMKPGYNRINVVLMFKLVVNNKTVVKQPVLVHPTPQAAEGASSDPRVNGQPEPRPDASPEDQTWGKIYVRHLLGSAREGKYPLARPDSIRDRMGGYTDVNGIRVGDVGVLHDERPFNTLFNLIEPEKNAPNNRLGVPEGFEPVVELKQWLQLYVRENETIVRPRGSASEHTNAAERTRRFELKSTSGALLALPRGSCLHSLGAHRARFETCVKNNRQQWFAFADEHEGAKSDRTLYLVTDVEKCSAWAMATWDGVSVSAGSMPMELVLTETSGRVGWGSRSSNTGVCHTSSHSNSLTRGFLVQILRFCGWNSVQELYHPWNQDVFVGGYWIDRRDNDSSSQPPGPQVPRSEHEDRGSGGSGSPRDFSDRNPFRNRQNGSNPSGTGPPETYTTAHGTNDYSLDLRVSTSQITTVTSDRLSLRSGVMVSHPCVVINRFALALLEIIDQNAAFTSFRISRDAVAFSHDKDFMSLEGSVVTSIDGEGESSASSYYTPLFGYDNGHSVTSTDAVYPQSMHGDEKNALGLLNTECGGNSIPVLLEYREPNHQDSSPARPYPWQLEKSNTTSTLRQLMMSLEKISGDPPIVEEVWNSWTWVAIATTGPGSLLLLLYQYSRKFLYPCLTPLELEKALQSLHDIYQNAKRDFEEIVDQEWDEIADDHLKRVPLDPHKHLEG
ncbi:hypothetical protein V5O48_010608 [Marasmius crinis-equi]|uniref:Uncharacterized protein n=1 Tax=Marasmius crinis-equi TaxID=585013 RepID=A0ABR3F7X9_9AGAR